ncbi:alpha/beta hydrolase [Pantoea sp. USHLN256]|uniref:alpha/beta hydrolase n=1 Tax=Pantoea sp. USHLN256 TaxID=3081293 RepID=UPI0030182A7B
MSKTPGGLSRRNLIFAGSVASAGLLMAAKTRAALVPTPRLSGTTTRVDGVTIQSVMFRNNEIMMSGNLYLPKAFSPARRYAGIVVVHPGGGVKEQTAGLYALKLAAEGFITLAFDASHQGASGGLPRFVDDPMKRVVDFYSAVDYLATLPYVDSTRMGALGVCAGSGITVKASMTDRRIKALATVSAVDVGAATRKGWEGKTAESELIPTLEAVAKQRESEAAGGAAVYVNYVPKLGDTSAPRDLQEAADYYLTPRGHYPTSTNQMLMTSISTLASFTGFAGADVYITQPLLMVAGSEAGSLWHSQQLNQSAASANKQLFIIPGATHMDLYDGEGANKAARQLAPFFRQNLASS